MFIRNAITRMPKLLCAGWAVVVIISSSATAQDSLAQSNAGASKQPAVRYVSSRQAEVMAGPGDDFYPTAIVDQGQSLEVHQETADGWLAITPPPGSFSWLPASQGLLLPGGRIVEVTEKSAVSWIGSSLGTAKQYRWQVKLERGQQLAVIGEQTMHDTATGSKALWFKIVPPPGEYRWIPSKATSKQPPAEPTKVGASSASESIVNDESANDTEDSSQVVQASAQQAMTGKNMPRATTRSGNKSANHSHQHTDRWAEWHAMEFKNGSFSFPGMARMFGMQPAPTNRPSSNSAASDDPFDLTAAYSRSGTRQPTPDGKAKQNAPATEDIDDAMPDPSAMAVRQSRGWRDPRQLRQERIRGSLGENFESDESGLAMEYGSGSHLDSVATLTESSEEYQDVAEVMDAAYEEDHEVGSAVVTAGANEPRRSRATSGGGSRSLVDAQPRSEQAWYGIEQAPASRAARPTSMSQADLGEIQLELSTMVAGPEQTWNLAPLADRARYFIEHGRDSIERGQARLLLERIDSFAAVARQSTVPGAALTQAVGGQSAGPAPVGTTAASASWIAPANVSGGTGDKNESRFDATGWLVPVHTSGRDMPTHALTNDAGKIIVYVTAAPGVNLTRFESQAIGVYGLRGYLPQLKTNHIQIQRVVRLQ